jgi:hypothetical protein
MDNEGDWKEQTEKEKVEERGNTGLRFISLLEGSQLNKHISEIAEKIPQVHFDSNQSSYWEYL